MAIHGTEDLKQVAETCAPVEIVRWQGNTSSVVRDVVAREEPLEILVNGDSLAVTMRTPGDDFALAAGFLFAESQIHSSWDIQLMGYAGRPGDPDRQNLLNVSLRPSLSAQPERPSVQRNFLATSSCGVCGKATLSAARCLAAPLAFPDFHVAPDIFRGMNAAMRAAQATFERTGGLHAAALFDCEGRLLSLREDVGRHNAVDKLIGAELLAGNPILSDRVMMVSGRTSFEIVQKAAMARIPLICGVSAPSSLAIRLAHDLNITLVGFLRGDSMNVYTHPDRIAPRPPSGCEEAT